MDKTFLKFFAVLFTIGLVNNIGYVMISVGAQAIADKYNKTNLMPLFQLMLVVFNILILVVNFRYLVMINTLVRVSIVTSMMLIAYIVISVCSLDVGSWGFPVALIATLMMGSAQSWGECMNLAFNRSFPSEYVLGFSSGTGFAGVAGSGTWIILKALNVPNYAVFLLVCPALIAYWLCFYWIYQKAKTNKQIELRLNADEILNSSALVSKTTGNSLFSMKQLKLVYDKVGFWAFNLSCVYFLEYIIITGFADRATLKYEDDGGFFKKNSFIILQFCYQFGVLISRSSLQCFRISSVWILTVIQAVNFAIWWIEAEFLLITEWGEFVLMIWVGLMGGASYVNVAYLILSSEELPTEEKEASMNFVFILVSIGIILSSLFCLVLDNYIMTN